MIWNESFLLPLSRSSCSPCRQKRDCVLEKLMSAGPWTAEQRRFGIMKMEIWFGWFYHPYPSTFSSAVLLLLTSASVSSFTAESKDWRPCFHSGIPKRPQGSWSCSRSPPGLWPHDFSFGSQMQRLSNLQKEGKREREGTGKKIGMRERMEGGGRIIYPHPGRNRKGQEGLSHGSFLVPH